MKRTMLFGALFAASASLAATGVVFAQDAKVSEVAVAAELEDMQNANALQFWPNIEKDLAAVISDAAKDKISDEGYEIDVRIKEISMSGSTVLSGEGEFNHLEGWVYFREPGNPVPVEQEAVVVDAYTGDIDPGAAIVILPGVPDFYAGLLHGFSKGTMDQLALLDGESAVSGEPENSSDQN